MERSGHHMGHTGGFGESDHPIIKAIMGRRSIRSYLDVPVEWDKIISCIEAGMVAPNAGNLQIWRFVVVRNLDKRKQIAEACLQQYWMEQAPVHVVIFAKLGREEKYYGIRGTRLYSIQDCAMAAENIMLAAGALELGTCFTSAFDEEAISRIFRLPDGVRPQGVITMGYTEEHPTAPIRYRVESLIGIENYGMAMNEGQGGRVVGGAPISTFRYAEGIQKYTQTAADDIGKVVGHKGKKLFGKLFGKFEKKTEEKKE